MRIIIVGGGKLAYYLIKTLQPYHHIISVVEQLKEVSERIATDFDEVSVYNGDGTNIRIMEESGCRNADFYIAVTGKDESNLIGCEIAKKHFHVKTTVARVNNPKNCEMFTRMGVDKIYSSTQILADIIEREIDYEGMRVVFSIEKTSQNIIEFKLSPKSAACNMTLRDYAFPKDSTLVLLTRDNGTVEVPHGDLIMKAEDTILMACEKKDYDLIWKDMVKR